MNHRGLLALALAGALAAGCATPAERAMWTWEPESYAMVEHDAVADEALQFLRRKGVGTLYLYADAFGGRNLITGEGEPYRRLLRRVHAQGFRAYALLGSAYLQTEEYVLPEKRDAALLMLRRVLAYNAAAVPESRFDGISLDIEPHILPQWSSNRLELLRDFLEMSAALMKLKREAGQAALPLGAAVPFWLDGIPLEWRGVTKPASEHVLDTLDYIALMDYRDHADGPDGIIRHASTELAYAQSIGRKVVIGVEVSPNELAKVTFNRRSEAQFERELERVERAYAGNPAFAGFAIHHYRSYRTWLGAQDQ